MARKYDVAQMLGNDFEFELTPDALAYELSMDFANQVVKPCDKMDLSLTDLSNLLGLSVSTLSEKLNGQNLTLKSIAALALALGCDVRAPELIPNSDAKCSPTETT
jgi:transcriptional regulator with XRE-family HTH domain